MDINIEKQSLREWLEYTKSLNLTLEELAECIAFSKTCSPINYSRLKGQYSKDKAKILFDLWESEKKPIDTSYLIPILKKYNIN